MSLFEVETYDEGIEVLAYMMAEHLFDVGADMSTGRALYELPKRDALLVLLEMSSLLTPTMRKELGNQIRVHVSEQWHRRLRSALGDYGLKATF